MADNNNFSGAGILPIVKFNDNYYFIIFKSGVSSRLFKKGDKIEYQYDDAGGSINKGEKDIMNIAIRELFEESSCLINLDNYKKELKESVIIDITNKNKIYRSYICLLNIPKFNLNYYKSNLDKFNKNLVGKLLSMFNENTHITLLPVNFSLRKTNYVDKSDNIIYASKDYLGENIYLNNRLYNILIKFRELNKSNVVMPEIKLKKDILTKFDYINYFGIKLQTDNLITYK